MRMRRWGRLGFLAAGVALLGTVTPVMAAGRFPYSVLRRIELTSAGRITALLFDPNEHAVYLAQGRSVRAYPVGGFQPVIRRRLAGDVSALAQDAAGDIIAAVRHPAQLVFLAPRTLRVMRRRALGSLVPAALLYDRQANMLFLAGQARGLVERLDPASGTLLGRVRLGGVVGQMAGNGRGTLYVANPAHDALDVIDAHRMRYAGSIPLGGCHEPHGLAMDTIGRRLFVACANGRALVVDADLGFTFKRFAIPPSAGQQVSFGFHPLGSRRWKGGVFICGDAAVTAIQMQAFVRYRLHGLLPLSGPCSAMVLAAPAGELWLALAPLHGRAASLWVLGATAREAR